MPYGNNSGLPLTVANDAITVVLANSALSQDAQAAFTVTPYLGSYTGVTVVFEKAFTKADFDAGTWTALSGVSRLDTGVALAGNTISLPNSGSINFGVSFPPGFYAIRMRIVAITSGGLTVECLTAPAGSAAAQLLVQATLTNTYMKAVALGLSFQTDTDLVDAVGGTW